MSTISGVSTIDGPALPSDFVTKLSKTKVSSQENEKSSSDSSDDNTSVLANNELGYSPAIKATEKELDKRDKLFPEAKKVLKQDLDCSACGVDLAKLIRLGGPVYTHPILGTLMCKECREYYGDGNFSTDEDGTENYCKLCGQGGEMYCCTDCTCVFCKECVKLNFNRSFVKTVEESDDWTCFVCNIKPLWELRAICWAVHEYIYELQIAKREETKRKLQVLAAKCKDSPDKPKGRRQLKWRKSTSSDENNSAAHKEKKTSKEKPSRDTSSDSSNSSRSSSSEKKKKVLSKRLSVPSNKSDIIVDSSSDSEFEERSRKKDAKKLKPSTKTRKKEKPQGKNKTKLRRSDTEDESEDNVPKSKARVKQTLASTKAKKATKRKHTNKRKDSSDESISDSDKKREHRNTKRKHDSSSDLENSSIDSDTETNAKSKRTSDKKVTIPTQENERISRSKRKPTSEEATCVTNYTKHNVENTDSFERCNGFNFPEIAVTKSTNENKDVANSLSNIDLEEIPDIDTSDLILPLTMDKETELDTQEFLAQQCLDLQLLSENLCESVKKIQEQIKTGDPVKLQNSMRKIQSLIVQAKENMDNQSCSFKMRCNKWTKKVAKTKCVVSKHLSEAGSDGSHSKSKNDLMDADKGPVKNIEETLVERNLSESMKDNDMLKNGFDRAGNESTSQTTQDYQLKLNDIRVKEIFSIVPMTSDSIKEDLISKDPGRESSVRRSLTDLFADDDFQNHMDVDDTIKSLDLDLKENDQAKNISSESEIKGALNESMSENKSGENSRDEDQDKKTSEGIIENLFIENDHLNKKESGQNKGKEKAMPKSIKDKKALLASSSSDDEPLVKENSEETKQKGKAMPKSMTAKEALLASSSSDDEPLVKENSEETKQKGKAMPKSMKDKEALLASSSSDDEPLVKESSDETKGKGKAMLKSVTAKEALLASSSSDDDPLVKEKNGKDQAMPRSMKVSLCASSSSDKELVDTEKLEKENGKLEVAEKTLKDLEALFASSSSDDEPLIDNKCERTKGKDSNDEQKARNKPEKGNEKEKATAKALKDREALLASSSSDEELIDNGKEKKEKGKVTSKALKDKEALLASSSSDEELIDNGKEKKGKGKVTSKALKDKEALLASSSSGEELIDNGKEKKGKGKVTSKALKDKEALLASSSSDDDFIHLDKSKRKGGKEKTAFKTSKDKKAPHASSSNDEENTLGGKKTERKNSKAKGPSKEVEDKEALLASSSSDDHETKKTVLNNKDSLSACSSDENSKITQKALLEKGKKANISNEEEQKSTSTGDKSSKNEPKAKPKKKHKVGPKSQVHNSSDDSLSDFNISVNKRKRKPHSKPKFKRRHVNVDLESYGDLKLTYKQSVNIVKLTEDDLRKHNIHELPKCAAQEKKSKQGSGTSGNDSDDVERLLDMKSLKRARRRRSSTHSDSTKSDSSAKDIKKRDKKNQIKQAKKKKKKDEEEKLLDYLHKKISDDSTSSGNEDDNDPDRARKKQAHLKKKLELQKKEVAKQMLLDELMSSSEASDTATPEKKEDVKKKKVKKSSSDDAMPDKEEGKEKKMVKEMKNEEEEEVVGSDNNLSDNEEGKEKQNKKKKESSETSDEDKDKVKSEDEQKSEDGEGSGDDSESQRKKKKKTWRNNKLLRGKISETDTSDDERKWEAKKKRDAKEETISEEDDEDARMISKLSRKQSKRKVVNSDTDDDVVAAQSSSSSSSEDFVSTKKKKRPAKKKTDSSDSEFETPKKKVKRRRIKAPASDTSGSDDDMKESQQSTPGKGRKNIRKLLTEDSVGERTKRAAKEEEERRKRILEKQALYNKIYENLQSGVEQIDKLVLDFDPVTKEELVSADENLVPKLKPHQVQGVKFMWDACFESVKRLQKSPGSGCILAHCMGLGKTFQVVTLVHTLLTNKCTKVKRVLVICPLSTALNWVNEFKIWLKDMPDDEEIDIYELSKFRQPFERSYQLKEWHQRGGVMVMSYDMFRNFANPVKKRIRKSIIETFHNTLIDPGPDLVICDEGHLLKNEKTAISKAVGKIRTLRRIALTGTPLQNNLGEYHCMVQFVKPNLLGTKKEFANRFINPITNGQFENSTIHDVKVMKRRAHVLHKMLEGCVQRFDYSVLTPFLPPKQEYVILVRLSDTQIKIYQHYLDNFAGKGTGVRSTKLFADFQYLQRVWTHPKVLEWNAAKTERLQLAKDESESEGSLRDFVVEDSEDDSDKSSSKSVQISDESKSEDEKSGSDVEEVVRKSSTRSARLASRKNKDSDSDVKDKEEQPESNPLEWWKMYTNEQDFDDIGLSGKLVLFFSILEECEKIGDKVLVFSQSMFTLDLLEHFLSLIDAETQRNKKGEVDEETLKKLGKHTGSWARGLDYFRLDGSVSGENRSIACKLFNKEDNYRARLYLISTRAGGLGINLFAANRVIIFDASWNPSHDVQSIFRVYRFGQKKPCYIYRFLASGTMEERIYERQVTKLSLSCRVVDEQQIERHYTSHDLQEMYTFIPQPESKKETPLLPRDRLLAELLKEHGHWIETYHEHDSLLENKEEEELNEEERKAAWDDYENEKKAPAYGIQTSNVGLNNYLTYIQSLSPDAIREVLRKENPLASEDQITERVRLLMAAAYKHYEQQQHQQAMAKQLQAYHAMQNQQLANQVAFGGGNHPTGLYVNNAAAMPSTNKFNQAMLGQAAGASILAGNYNYPTGSMPKNVSTLASGSGGTLRVRNFASMQDAPRMTFKTVPTIRPLNMNTSSNRGGMLITNPLYGATKSVNKPIVPGGDPLALKSDPRKSPVIETIDSD